MHRSKQHPYSITSSAVASTCGGAGALSDRLLERKHHNAVRAECSCKRRGDASQVAKVHEGIGRHDQVEGLAVIT
jgi:hypothetical protein